MSSTWIDAAAVGVVPSGDVIGIEVAGRDIALYEVAGEIFATSNICTHGHARMSDGFLECPLHQGRFDVCTGKAMCAPLTDDIPTYPVRIEQGRIFIALD
jgi:naphthalene 1,2-dioxygenase system ferredoxin subunit